MIEDMADQMVDLDGVALCDDFAGFREAHPELTREEAAKRHRSMAEAQRIQAAVAMGKLRSGYGSFLGVYMEGIPPAPCA